LEIEMITMPSINRSPVRAILSVIPTVMMLAGGCVKAPGESADGETSAAPIVQNQTIQGGIAIPSEVRRNLGITFATVERRQVQDTLRVPGVFEPMPNARHEYRAPLAGHIRIKVTQFAAVNKGDLLFTLDSPDWRRVQHEAVEAECDIKMAEAGLKVAESRFQEAQSSATIVRKRLENLASAQVRKAELEADAATLEGSLVRLKAEIEAANAALDEANEHYISRLRTLASITTLSTDELLKPTAEGVARWRTIDALEICAEESGTIELVSVNDGGWRETGELVVQTLDPTAVRFHAEAPQSELVRLNNGAACTIVPPLGGGVDVQSAITGTMQIGLTAHPEERTISLYVSADTLRPWVKAGVSAYLEIPRETSLAELSIPVASLVQDGLETVFFRRHPKDANRAIPVKADLGPSDGRWVVVRSGVKEGDEVVLDGAYALKLAGGANKPPAGYHYHTDGQLHKNH
jgi:multidrug efflux pump subunit AcrA (membrane-fusion protein)